MSTKPRYKVLKLNPGSAKKHYSDHRIKPVEVALNITTCGPFWRRYEHSDWHKISFNLSNSLQYIWRYATAAAKDTWYYYYPYYLSQYRTTNHDQSIYWLFMT